MPLINKRNIFILSAISLVGFLFPFVLKDTTDSWNSVLSLSFTILGTIATIATLIVAFLLYDRFGISAKFKENQVDKVIELAILLKEINITISSNKRTYFVHKVQSDLKLMEDIPGYTTDSAKTVLFPDNFFGLINNVTNIRKNHWLPKEIKDRMKFLDIPMLIAVENPLSDEYVRLNLNNSASNVWMQSHPKLSFYMIAINLHNLFKEINSWLSQHSSIQIDLELY